MAPQPRPWPLPLFWTLALAHPLFWLQRQSQTSSDLYSVHFPSADLGCAVGSHGTLVCTRDGGKTWAKHQSQTSEWLNAIHFPSPDGGCAVGGHGLVICSRDGGENWAKRESQTSENLQALHFPKPEFGCAVGAHGTVVCSSDGGKTWAKRQSQTSEYLYSVYFASPMLGCACGNHSVLICSRDGGETWTQRLRPSAGLLGHVHFHSPELGCAVGAFGALVCSRDGGETWAARMSQTSEWLQGVHIVSPELGFAVGNNGALLCSRDGGKTWAKRQSQTSAELISIQFRSPEQGCAVGDHGILICSHDGGKTWVKHQQKTSGKLYTLYFPSLERGCAVGGSGALVCELPCPAGQVPNRAGTACGPCPAGQVREAEQSSCEGCLAGHVPQEGQAACQRCPAGRVRDKEQSTCERCPAGHIPEEEQISCERCPTGQVPDNETRLTCQDCQVGRVASGDTCGQCDGGMEPDLHQGKCRIFSRWAFLLARARMFLCIDGLLVLGTLVGRTWYHFKSDTAGYTPLASESVKTIPPHWHASRARFWQLCPCLPQPLEWDWWVLAGWDVLDWFLLLCWFLYGEPARNEAATFETDIWVAVAAASLLFLGPVLPVLVCVLPRKYYVFVEVVFDIAEFLIMTYCQSRYGFTNRSIALIVLNYASTVVDLLFLKGPEGLDDLLKHPILDCALLWCRPDLQEPREAEQVSFEGRFVSQQHFSVVSFPGAETKAWKDITENEKSDTNPANHMSVACVFFPDTDPHFYGKHSNPCMCRYLYEFHDPKFNNWPGDWPNKKAPHGCEWFKQWRDNVAKVLDFKQTPVVVYKRGKLFDNKGGLGCSQRGEVQWLEAREPPPQILRVDLDVFRTQVATRAREQKGVTDLLP